MNKPGNSMNTQSFVHSTRTNCNPKDMKIWETILRINGRHRVCPQYLSHYVDIITKLQPLRLFNQTPCRSRLHTTSHLHNTLTSSMHSIRPSPMASSSQPSSATPLQAFPPPFLPLNTFVVTPCLGRRRFDPFLKRKWRPDRPPTITYPPPLLINKQICKPITTKWCPTPLGLIFVVTTFLGALNISQSPQLPPSTQSWWNYTGTFIASSLKE